MSIPIWRSGCCACSLSSTNRGLPSSLPPTTSRSWTRSTRVGLCCTRVVCMSTTDVSADIDIKADAQGSPSPVLSRLESPIVPQATISGRALVAIVAIMTFLASLTTGAVMLVRAAANEWQSDVAREITIQIRPTAGRDIETEVAKVVAITRAFPGVAEVRPYSKEQATRLLEPWLGSGMRFEELPIPRLAVL